MKYLSNCNQILNFMLFHFIFNSCLQDSTIQVCVLASMQPCMQWTEYAKTLMLQAYNGEMLLLIFVDPIRCICSRHYSFCRRQFNTYASGYSSTISSAPAHSNANIYTSYVYITYTTTLF